MAHACCHELEAKLSAAPKSAGVRYWELIRWAATLTDEGIHALGGEDEVVALINENYDKFIAPIDIPWVPNVLEPSLIDAPAKQLLEGAFRAVHAKVHPQA